MSPRRAGSASAAERPSPPATPEALLSLLERHSGVVHVANPPGPDRAKWRRLIHACKQHGHVPDGWHLLHSGRDSGDIVIELRQGEHPFRKYTSAPKPLPIPVPDSLSDPHPVAAALREQPNRLPASRESRSRCFLIVDALAREAERRGHLARGGTGSALLVITVEDVVFSLAITEETTRRQTERLVLTLSGPGEGTARWADYAKSPLEQQLAAVIDEISRRGPIVAAERAERHRREQKIEEEKRQRAEAERQREITAHRAEILRGEVQRWRQAEEIRAHCAAVESAGLDHDDEWLRWARDYADSIDPALAPHGVPPAPTAEELQQRRRRAEQQQQSAPTHDPSIYAERPWHPNQRWYHRR